MVALMQKLITVCFVLVLLLVSSVLYGYTVPNLSKVCVPIAKRSPEAVAQMAPKALAEVLIKMSGNPSVIQLPELQQALQHADQLVQSFGYVSQVQDGAAQLYANIQFDSAALKQLLHQVHQVVWRADRPITLAWIQIDRRNNNPNPVLANDEQSPMIMVLKQTAEHLGLPLILPLMDIQDQNYIDTADGVPFDHEKLLEASKRYQSSSVLGGKITIAADGSWRGQWLYVLNGQSHQWDTVGQTQQEMIQQVMNDVDSVMSSTLAVRDNEKLQSTVTLHILDVIDLNAYALIIQHLKQLSVVAHVGVSQLDGSTMKLTLSVVGGCQALVAALKDDADLIPASQPFIQRHVAPQNGLFYKFQTQDSDAL